MPRPSRKVTAYQRKGVSRDMAYEVSCHRCGAASGFPCMMDNGQVRLAPHVERYQTAAKASPRA